MGKCVLIVDDHEVVRRSLRTLFEDNRFNVFEASNGAEAIQQAQQVHPDLVVLDMIMPVMNGLDAARELKHLTPGTPLLLFTNLIGPVMEEEARSAGISAVVSKSESAERLLDKADALV